MLSVLHRYLINGVLYVHTFINTNIGELGVPTSMCAINEFEYMHLCIKWDNTPVSW